LGLNSVPVDDPGDDGFGGWPKPRARSMNHCLDHNPSMTRCRVGGMGGIGGILAFPALPSGVLACDLVPVEDGHRRGGDPDPQELIGAGV
jgi:hypothetical protein